MNVVLKIATIVFVFLGAVTASTTGIKVLDAATAIGDCRMVVKQNCVQLVWLKQKQLRRRNDWNTKQGNKRKMRIDWKQWLYERLIFFACVLGGKRSDVPFSLGWLLAIVGRNITTTRRCFLLAVAVNVPVILGEKDRISFLLGWLLAIVGSQLQKMLLTVGTDLFFRSSWPHDRGVTLPDLMVGVNNVFAITLPFLRRRGEGEQRHHPSCLYSPYYERQTDPTFSISSSSLP